MRWDLFCRVVDNHGDLGVCWRLAADLAARGEMVRLWVDDATALSWMAPAGAAGVEVQPWPARDPGVEPGDVVVEAFGCELPPFFVGRMAARSLAPVWINLEYLSAEDYVERSHRLPSPQPNGLTKWFFYPGFTPRTGGLLREPGLIESRRAFDAAAWRSAHGVHPTPGERLVSLFCYANAALPALMKDLAREPTLLLATPGPAAQQARAVLGPSGQLGALRCIELPFLTQRHFDRLLWSCDLNFVRGEDSAVRAIWAGVPFVWQFYPQQDNAHLAKLEAFLSRYRGELPAGGGEVCAALWRAWNGASRWPGLPDAKSTAAWQAHALSWRDHLATQADLCTQLAGFVREKR
ncbi:MAG: elongation factor P maturation arginine rhamnosyltransferase EarP [Piscinibacter sp.]|uniref:elongation factor P maturation arginine rhamnosyltransferase EarP n=1 Tax=Piscinibacter sp. TaxID=1903157 RepID=UPI003D0D7ECE